MSNEVITRITNLAKDPIFWTSTIVCGLLVTILGNFATRVCDRAFTSYRLRRRDRSGVVGASIQAAANHLKQHPAERFDLKLDVLFFNQSAILCSAWTVALLVLDMWIFRFKELGLNEYLFLVIFGLSSLATLACLFTVLFFLQREQRALRVLQTYLLLANQKTYSDVLDEVTIAHRE